MSLYLDTSCLLKLLFPEPESDAVARLLEAEARVVVSTLARLETLGHLQGRVAGGSLTGASARALRDKLAALLAGDPYEVVALPPSAVELALGQIALTRRAAHCRTLDRLHLATMQAVGLRRILTNDDPQAKAACALGFEALLPR
jgi:predicted nucleic acid-binding protein